MHRKGSWYYKGQLTLFILLGIFIIMIFVVVQTLMHNQLNQPRFTGQEDAAKTVVSDFVQDCLNHALEDSLYSIGQVGSTELEPFILFEDSSVGVLFNGTTNLLPSLSAYGTEIAQGAIIPFTKCISDQEPLPFTIDIDTEHLDFLVSFENTITHLEAHIPITIIVGSSITTLSTFSTTAPVSFAETHALVSTYLTRISSDPYLIPIDLLLFGDVNAAIYPLDETSILIQLIDPGSTVGGNAWSFQFGIQFPLGDYP
ncbi:MAG: hypothetical protein AABX52_03825 [Nanoarchaeota archaeon]